MQWVSIRAAAGENADKAGGKQMDMFMDKLAQKLTAQEIIKANTAADMEELNRLKNQIAEYNECLARLQKLIDDGETKLEGIQNQNQEMGSVVGAGFAEIQGHLDEIHSMLERNLGEAGEHRDEMNERFRKHMDELREYINEMDNLDQKRSKELQVQVSEIGSQVREESKELRVQVSEIGSLVREESKELQVQVSEIGSLVREGNNGLQVQANGISSLQACSGESVRLAQESISEIQELRQEIDSLRQIQGKLVEKLDSVDKSVAWQLEFMTKSMEDKLSQLMPQEDEEGSERLGERMDAMEEAVHRECVKVYRNVQAVVTEEGGKKDEVLTEMKGGMAELKGRLGAVLAFSILALVLSLAGIAFQVLGRLGILPF